MEKIELNVENFRNEVLEEKDTVLVDFFADWCAPCRSMDGILEDLAQENPNLKIGSVNVDNEPELADTFDVTSVPTLFLFHNGSVEKRLVGLCSKEKLQSVLHCEIQR